MCSRKCCRLSEIGGGLNSGLKHDGQNTLIRVGGQRWGYSHVTVIDLMLL